MIRWVVVPDMQIPDHDMKAIESVYRFIEATKPEGILIVGDELDAPEPSRWNKGYAGEFAPTLQKSIDKAHEILAGFRAAIGSEMPIHLMRSNHGERIQTYIHRYAPALGSLAALDYPTLLGLDDIDVTYHRQPFEFAPGWVLSHGDEGSLTQTSGGTAMGLAKKWGKSVVCGHTHRAGIQHQHLAVNAKVTTHLFGMEVGHLMSMNRADYLKAGYANWQQAIGLIDVDKKTVIPTLLPMFDSKVTYNGVTY